MRVWGGRWEAKLGVRKQEWCEEDQGRGGEECEGGGRGGSECDEEGVSVRRERV